jgi:hypothetical protein
MLKRDLGCRAAKRPQFIGEDIVGQPDVLGNIAQERLLFDDASADHIFRRNVSNTFSAIFFLMFFEK